MVNRRFFMRALSALGFAAILPIALHSKSYAATAVAKFDKDNDGTVDLNEAKEAAGSLFDRLEKEGDTTLDQREIGKRLSKKEFKEADTDQDGTLTKDEYLAAVEKKFEAADPDKDGTLTGKEFRSKAGRELLRLLD